MNQASYMSRSFTLILLASIIVLTSCTGRNDALPRSIKEINQGDIYFDYKITGEEGNKDVIVMLQYLYGSENGSNLKLEKPGKVEVDGEELKGDSSKITGAFYEQIKPLEEFTGPHIILFTDCNKMEYKDSFIFQPITLIEIPGTIRRKDLMLELEGLNPEEYIRLLLTDTSSGDGINRVDTVSNGQVTITKKDLSGFVNGPLHLELIKEDERPVKNGTKTGGKFSISYGLKRDIILED